MEMRGAPVGPAIRVHLVSPVPFLRVLAMAAAVAVAPLVPVPIMAAVEETEAGPSGRQREALEEMRAVQMALLELPELLTKAVVVVAAAGMRPFTGRL